MRHSAISEASSCGRHGTISIASRTKRIARLETTKSPGQAIVGIFREIVHRSLADSQHRGLVNATLEATAGDPELKTYLANETIKIEQFFRRCVAAGQRSGEISIGFRDADEARHLLSLRVLAGVRPEASLLNGLAGPGISSAWPSGKRRSS
jgi:TetR/AcrR family transcriptional regulator, transcriptional repressor for nem operon